MMSIFFYFIENIMDVYMDDFLVYNSTFESCLSNLSRVLQCCEGVDLVLNWQNYYFMVRQGIVLGHLISERGIKVDKVKIEVIENMPPPTSVKGVRSFLGPVGFSHIFIKYFSKIAIPLTNLLLKDVKFCFD